MTSPNTHPPRTINDLAALGQKGPSWEFLVHAQASPEAVAQVPGIRFLVAMNLAKLGLKELAAGQLAALGAAEHPDVMAVARAIAAMPTARIEREGLMARAREALAILGDRLGVEGDALAAAEELLGRVEVHAARDGNVVLQMAGAGGGDLAACSTLADINGVMAGWKAKRDGGATSDANPNVGFAFPVVVDGMLPPTVALAVWRGTRVAHLGHTPRIYLVSGHIGEHVVGLALGLWLEAAGVGSGEFGEMLADARVEHFAGVRDGVAPAERLGAQLRERLDLAMPVTVVTSPLTPTHARPLGALQGARDAQGALRAELTAELGARHGAMTPEDWKRRIFGANGGVREGARVLIPTGRFTTYLQHAAHGLAGALERRGVRAHVHMEPDGHSVFDPVARLVAIRDANPDVVIRINSPRMHGTDAASEAATRIPTITWVQDAMPHLFDAKMGASVGPFEVLVGCRVPELVRVFGYPRARCEAMPVVADESRFNAGVAGREDAGMRDDLECEIAYASHHAATTMQLHERIAADSPANVRPVLERVYPHALIYAADPFARPLKQYLRGAARDAIRECLGIEADAAMIAKITNSYAMAIADRALRHRVLEGAASVAQRRGWRLRIYGNGWESHPTLGAFARPALGHDADLARSYARAKVHLHISHHGPLHQRVFECAMSGGVPAVLVTPAFVSAIWAWAASEATDAGTRLAMEEPIARSWACMAACACMQRLGLTEDAWYPRDGLAKHALADAHIPDTERAARDLPLAIAEAAFADDAGLERVVERAIASPGWRASTSEAIARRVRTRLTQDALVGVMLDLMRRAVEVACGEKVTRDTDAGAQVGMARASVN